MNDQQGTYLNTYRSSLEEREAFWAEAASAITWDRTWDRVLDDTSVQPPRWFKGARMNTCFNALDRHVDRGHGDQVALIHDSPVTSTVSQLTYAQLLKRVSKFAGALRVLGVGAGDRVVIYLPMIPEAVVGMLACARLGAIHSVVFGGFAAKELASRIDHAQPKVVLTASHGIEPTREVPYLPLLEEALSLASHQPERLVILRRNGYEVAMVKGRDLDWMEAEQAGTPTECTVVAATDPLYILYTSGTTGKPKGVVRDNGGHAVALRWSMAKLYGVAEGEVFWAASDIGWVVGHSYIVYGPLLGRNTTIIYEGKPVGTPDAGSFWRVASEHRVSVMFTAPTAIRAIRRDDPAGELLARHPRADLRALYLAGERCDPDTLGWAGQALGVPVIDHWWQTETGWPIACNPLGLERLAIEPGSAGAPVPGYDIRILDSDGEEVETGKVGGVALKLPLPPGCLSTLWNDDAGFVRSYLERFPGFYDTSDAGFFDENGHLFVMGRTDDIINVAGHRLSTGAMEEAVSTHPDVAECAVIGVHDGLKGQVPLALVVLSAGADRDEIAMAEEVSELVRDTIGPVASLRKVVVVDRLPKTRSGKILRSTMRAIADGQPWSVPATIEEPDVLSEISAILAVPSDPSDPS